MGWDWDGMGWDGTVIIGLRYSKSTFRAKNESKLLLNLKDK